MLSRAVRWAANDEFYIQVKAPMCVQSTFWKQSTGRTIVHLWNGLNTTSDHGQQDVEVPLREESVAIHGIELKVKNSDFSKWEAVPNGGEIKTRIDRDVTIFEIPPVEVHSAIVFE